MTATDTPAARLCGDDLVTLTCSDAVAAQQLAAALRASRHWVEVVPGMDSVVVQFDAARLSGDEALALLRGGVPRPGLAEPVDAQVLRIPVHYGGQHGPDLERVCTQLDLSPAEFVRRHTAGEHRVAMLGFTPGFAYLDGLDPRLNVARLAAPRPRIAAGAVGIAAAYTGLYALPGPGGWPIVGHTDLPLFEAAREDPFRLAPGRRVRFVAVGTAAA